MTLSNSRRRFGLSGRFYWSVLLIAMLLVSLPAAFAQNGYAPAQSGPALYGPTNNTSYPNSPDPNADGATLSPMPRQTAGPPVQPQSQPPAQVPRAEATGSQSTASQGTGSPMAAPNEHPLAPAIRWAYQGRENLGRVQDYSATLVKRERIGNTLSDYEYLFVKIRKEPFSVYIYFLGPAAVKGREVIYVKGQNDGKLLAHGTGLQSYAGTIPLLPSGGFAMHNQRYPLTEIGLMNLVDRLIEIGQRDMKYGECDVQFFQGAMINNRSCTCIQVTHPVPRRNFLFHMARIFVDDELNIPVRYEAHSWPEKPGGRPVLLEEYTYLDVKLNNGFTDADFDVRNPNYKFR